MRKVLLGTGLAAAALTASANAAFVGFAARSDIVTVGVNTYTRIDVYAMFNNPLDKLLNVYNTSITLTGATQFYQAGTGAARSWNPDAMYDADTGLNVNEADSFVTIGGYASIFDGLEWFNSNPTNPDPNFTNWSGSASLNPPAANAGWFTPNPNGTAFGIPNQAQLVTGLDQNTTGSNLGVMVGRFSVSGLPDTNTRKLNFFAFITWNQVGQSGSQQLSDTKVFKYVPTPGALALLGLAGLAGRRRRA